MILLQPDQDKASLALAAAHLHPQPQPSTGDDKSALLPSPRPHRRTRFLRLSLLTSLALVFVIHSLSPFPFFSFSPKGHLPHHRFRPRPPLSTELREKLFLSVPNPESALAASRAYATHPHLAGSPEDFEDAKVILELFQSEFDISPPKDQPIFSAGTSASRKATLLLTTPHAPTKPTAWIDVYYPVLNTPKQVQLHILGEDGKPLWEANLEEDGDPADKEAHKYKDAVLAWHGFSRDGDVSGHLIYANYGRKEDYDELVAKGVDFTDKIVVVRYGAIFRGLKVKGAQELGAAGVLIYSDPRDDGFVTVSNGYSPYPHGPARNPSSVQRGSVQYLSMYPGDPTTPGYPAYENAERQEGENIPTIPSLPISWANAERLLEEIDGLHNETFTERTLSGNVSKAKIRLVNHVDTKVTPIWNTMASIPGHIRDEVVLIGCHRDAWVMGAADPTSGIVSLHEIIKGLGALLKKGWKPLRTIVIASWDAEEYGLVGSTEWGEDFASWISGHVVAYFNVDVSVAGSSFSTFASPLLAHLMKQVALDIPHPTIKGKTLWDAKGDEGPFKGEQATHIDSEFAESYSKSSRKLRAAKTGILPLGSGSDYTVFLQRLGVASSDEGFSMTPSDPVYHYHSIYDSQHWQEIYADPGFHRHVAIAKHLGLMGLRMADSIILPLNTTQYALELDDYLDEIETLIPQAFTSAALDLTALRKSIRRLQTVSLKLDEEKSEAEKDFKKLLKKLPLPHRPHDFHHRDPLRKVKNWVKSVFGVSAPTCEELRRLAILRGHVRSWEDILAYDLDELEKDLLVPDDDENEIVEGFGDDDEYGLPSPPPAHGHGHGFPFPIRKFIKAAKRVRKANQKLIAFERGFISEGGIKDREWYKHLGVAPGKWLGYGATTLPALAESITIEKNMTLAEYEANRLTELLDNLADVIKP